MEKITMHAALFLEAARGETEATRKTYWHPGGYIFTTDAVTLHAIRADKKDGRHAEGFYGYDNPSGCSFDLMYMEVETDEDGNETVSYLRADEMLERYPDFDVCEKEYVCTHGRRELYSYHPLRIELVKEVVLPPDAPCIKTVTVDRKKLIDALQSMPYNESVVTICVAGDNVLRVYGNDIFIGIGRFFDDEDTIGKWRGV